MRHTVQAGVRQCGRIFVDFRPPRRGRPGRILKKKHMPELTESHPTGQPHYSLKLRPVRVPGRCSLQVSDTAGIHFHSATDQYRYWQRTTHVCVATDGASASAGSRAAALAAWWPDRSLSAQLFRARMAC